MIIKYLKSIIWSISIIIISTIIVTILNYFNILNGIILQVIELLIPIIAILVGSYTLGKASNNKGYIEGLKYGTLWIVILIVINLVTKSVTWITILYLVIILSVSIFSSILGINKKK